jgi:hypothetical protein
LGLKTSPPNERKSGAVRQPVTAFMSFNTKWRTRLP